MTVKEAKAILYNILYHLNEESEYTEAINMAKEGLDLYRAKIEKGKWQEEEKYGCFICSKCGKGSIYQPTVGGKPTYNFCPLCGCKMEGVKK